MIAPRWRPAVLFATICLFLFAFVLHVQRQVNRQRAGINRYRVPTERERYVAARQAAAKVDANTPDPTGSLRTLPHEGHLFVVLHSYGLTHHPGCPCLTPTEARTNRVDRVYYSTGEARP